MNETDPNDFEKVASETSSNLVGELWEFLKHNKKWWLLPIIAIMLIFGVIIFLSGTGVAPFIYTLF